jgi:polysaccharide export outer membrane protein
MCHFFTVAAVVLVAGSAAAQSSPSATPRPATAKAVEVSPPSDYVIGAEDVVGVLFWRDTDMTADVTVRPDGMITLPLLGDLRAGGLTPDGLRDAVKKEASKIMEDPNVTVVIRTINSRKVFISGQVTNGGVYPLAAPRTVLQLIALAGGLTEYADSKNIRIVRTEQGRTTSLKFNYKDVSRGINLDQNIQLKPGDTVIVP